MIPGFSSSVLGHSNAPMLKTMIIYDDDDDHRDDEIQWW